MRVVVLVGMNKKLNRKRYKLGKYKEEINITDFYISNNAEKIFGIFNRQSRYYNMKDIDKELENIRNLSNAMYQDSINRKLVKFKK